MKGLMYKSKHN